MKRRLKILSLLYQLGISFAPASILLHSHQDGQAGIQNSVHAWVRCIAENEKKSRGPNDREAIFSLSRLSPIEASMIVPLPCTWCCRLNVTDFRDIRSDVDPSDPSEATLRHRAFILGARERRPLRSGLNQLSPTSYLLPPVPSSLLPFHFPAQRSSQHPPTRTITQTLFLLSSIVLLDRAKPTSPGLCPSPPTRLRLHLVNLYQRHLLTFHLILPLHLPTRYPAQAQTSTTTFRHTAREAAPSAQGLGFRKKESRPSWVPAQTSSVSSIIGPRCSSSPSGINPHRVPEPAGGRGLEKRRSHHRQALGTNVASSSQLPLDLRSSRDLLNRNE